MTKPNFGHHFHNVLRFMDDKLYASSAQIGDHLGSHGRRGFGTKVARQMSENGLLLWLPDVGMWRISAEGRKKLNSPDGA